jgi:gamma-glutamylcyclotransferase (GGCT)/AIG2-like uncharacterized protein YtfP
MSRDPCPNVFVYGTLRGESNNEFSRLLSEQAALIGRATMPGRLYRVDWFPGMVSSSDPSERVKGEVYRLRNPSETLPILDDYEGCGADDSPPFEFDRVLAVASMEDGSELECWVYLYRRQPPEARRIPSGDFLAIR